MSTPARALLLVTLACAVTAPDAVAQTSSRARERARIERERVEYEREIRARETRERLERERRDRDRREQQLRLDRERRARELYARQLAERRRVSDWRSDSDRPRVSAGGGIDVRRFDGDADRYVVHGGVDFRTRSGLGMRPEVFYAWSDRGIGRQTLTDANGIPVGVTGPFGRSRALGVTLNATYTFLRNAPVRPYVVGGVGLISTRERVLDGTTTATQLGTRTVHELDVGLNSGAGLEFALGPVRLFSELRYLLTDSPTARGFSGMLPITAGIRF